MKNILFVFLLFTTNLFGQEVGDIGYLYIKDGSVIYGMITQLDEDNEIVLRLDNGEELLFSKRQLKKFSINKGKFHFMGNRMPSPKGLSTHLYVGNSVEFQERYLLEASELNPYLGAEIHYIISPFNKMGFGVNYQRNISFTRKKFTKMFMKYERQVNFRGVALFAGFKVGKLFWDERQPLRFVGEKMDYEALNGMLVESYIGVNVFTMKRLGFRVEIGFQQNNFALRPLSGMGNRDWYHLYLADIQFGITL